MLFTNLFPVTVGLKYKMHTFNQYNFYSLLQRG